MSDFYFSGQGTVFVATRDSNGNPTAFRDVGNVPSLKITLATDILDHKESKTGQRLTDLRILRERRATVDITLENWSKDNLKMLLYGTSSTVSSGASVTNESLGTRAVGDIVQLAHPIVSALSVHDSAGSPATLVLNTDYSVDLNAGMIKILNLGSYTQPFLVNYTYGALDTVQLFKDSAKERYLRFIGLNTANSNTAVYVDLYRVVFDPAGDLELINDALAQFTLTGSILYDSVRDADSTLGGFGKIIQANSWT